MLPSVEIQSKSHSSLPETNSDYNKTDNIQRQPIESVDVNFDLVRSKDNLEASSSAPKTDDIELITTNNKRRNSKMNGPLSKYRKAATEPKQSLIYTTKVMSNVFKFLNTHELLRASQVCSAWNLIAMNKDLWQTVHLKSSRVYDWNKAIATFKSFGTVTLDTNKMLIPTNIEEFYTFWSQFSIAIKKAQQLKSIKLYRCPTSVVQDIINSLPQLEILNAKFLKNPYKYITTLNFHYLDMLENLTELRIKCLTALCVTNLPSFKNLVNLKYLSICSIKGFPYNVCQSLKTLSTNLVLLEIGDCNDLSKDLAGVLKRLTNLTSLRLENCDKKFVNYAPEVFCAIRSLNKLKILELINIKFGDIVEKELEKCVGIKALLIIPTYYEYSASTNYKLFACLKKLSKTLTHLIWGLTHELIRVTILFLESYPEFQNIDGFNCLIPYIPILKARNSKQQSGKNPVNQDNFNDKPYGNIKILSVLDLIKLLERMMIYAKTEVILRPSKATTQVYIHNYFKDLN